MVISLENLPEFGFSPDQAYEKVMELLQEVSMMGSNESEYPRFQAIVNGLKDGSIKPDDAVEQAQQIRYSKMECR